MAGLEIIIPTNFNNPLLPTVPVYGFKDTFDRADSPTLGTTSGESKTWERLHGLNVYGGRVSGQRATAAAEGVAGAWGAEVVNAQKANGTLRATLVNPGSKSGGLVLRASKNTDYLVLMMRSTSSNDQLVLQKKVGNATTNVALSTAAGLATAGAVFELVLDGASITVHRDGATVIPTQTVTEHASATKHGLYFTQPGADMVWDDVEFIPA